MLNCFLFEKFDLYNALCGFDSILLHYAKLFIRQSIDRKQIFHVTFETPPIEKSCVRHWVAPKALSFQEKIAFAAHLLHTKVSGVGFIGKRNLRFRI